MLGDHFWGSKGLLFSKMINNQRLEDQVIKLCTGILSSSNSNYIEENMNIQIYYIVQEKT